MPGGERPETGDARYAQMMEGLRRRPPLVRDPNEFAPGGVSRQIDSGTPQEPAGALKVPGAGQLPARAKR
jgi:hypothetical protein